MSESQEIPPVEGAQFKKKGCVNTKLLPIKLHYVLSYGALGGLLPYLPLIIKSIGINAAAYGIISTTIRFAVFLAKPILGAIADYSKNIRCVMIFVVLGSAVFHSILLLIQPIPSNVNKVIIECGGNSVTVELPFTYNISCMDFQRFSTASCEVEAGICAPNETDVNVNQNISGLVCESERESAYLNFSLIPENGTISHATEGKPLLAFRPLNTNENVSSSVICVIIQNYATSVRCLPSTKGCILPVPRVEVDYIYDTYQFWIVFMLTILGGICYTAVFSLSDAACYELLKNRPQYYGVQRMYGSAAGGIIALLAGHLNDLQTSFGSKSPVYTPGFIIMAVLTVLDTTLLLTQKDLKMSTSPTNLLKGVFLLFTSRRTAFFAAGVVLTGGNYALYFTYEYLFLQTLGASQLLIGTVVLVQTAVEVPFFFFSGWIIQKLGYSLRLVMVFAAYSLLYFLYSILKNPWYVLPNDLLQGVTNCIMISAMTSFASRNAPPGTEATMQGIFAGLFRGLGFGVGTLLGGFAFHKVGGHTTFLWAAIGCFICVFVFSFLSCLLKAENSAQSPESKIRENNESLLRIR